jgi:hypothetical protein
MLPKHFNGKVSSFSFGLAACNHDQCSKKDEKDDYDPAYRSFVFYRTLSPNEVSRSRWFAVQEGTLIQTFNQVVVKFWQTVDGERDG